MQTLKNILTWVVRLAAAVVLAWVVRETYFVPAPAYPVLDVSQKSTALIDANATNSGDASWQVVYNGTIVTVVKDNREIGTIRLENPVVGVGLSSDPKGVVVKVLVNQEPEWRLYRQDTTGTWKREPSKMGKPRLQTSKSWPESRFWPSLTGI